MADERILNIVMGLRPIDDDFMKIIFKDNNPLVEYVLRIILNKDDLIVERSETQYELSYYGSHKLFLDVFAKDSHGKSYNIEVQRSNSGAHLKRARYHASAIDVSALPKGSNYDDLPDTYVIFITEHDYFHKDRALYTLERVIAETGEAAPDGSHIIYVNGAYKNPETALGKLIHDFSCSDADTMLCEPMAEITRKYKTTNEGVDCMCKAVEDYGLEQRNEGRQEGILESIRNLLKAGSLSREKIAEAFHISLDEVNKIAEG